MLLQSVLLIYVLIAITINFVVDVLYVGSTHASGSPRELMTTIGLELSAAEPSPASARRRALRAALGNPIGAVGDFGALLLLFAAAFGPLLAPYDPLEQNMLARFAGRALSTGSGPTNMAGTCSRDPLCGRASILIH